MTKTNAPGLYTRRNSLRLSVFDYAARRLYFVTIVTRQRRKVFLDTKVAKATLESLSQLTNRMLFRDAGVYQVEPHTGRSPGLAICGTYGCLR